MPNCILTHTENTRTMLIGLFLFHISKNQSHIGLVRLHRDAGHALQTRGGSGPNQSLFLIFLAPTHIISGLEIFKIYIYMDM